MGFLSIHPLIGQMRKSKDATLCLTYGFYSVIARLLSDCYVRGLYRLKVYGGVWEGYTLQLPTQVIADCIEG